ncbi:MAG: hypothetical protein HY014_16385 [Acidobacteria bacterium]|nr:hypothetical protein [Acidobacteriota bacterium]MBI3489709.1 hypothetical protein [Acidobacteriota bacterium]
MQNLEALCDGIGPRLNGSAGLGRAEAWARLCNANGPSLDIAQWGWTGGTKGRAGRASGIVRGPGVLLEAPTVAALKPAEPLGAQDVLYARPGGSDQEPFRRAGLPAFVPRQEPLDYGTHVQHTRLDGVDRVAGEDLEQATQVMAILAWGLLNGPRLPHVAPDPS